MTMSPEISFFYGIKTSLRILAIPSRVVFWSCLVPIRDQILLNHFLILFITVPRMLTTSIFLSPQEAFYPPKKKHTHTVLDCCFLNYPYIPWYHYIDDPTFFLNGNYILPSCFKYIITLHGGFPEQLYTLVFYYCKWFKLIYFFDPSVFIIIILIIVKQEKIMLIRDITSNLHL